LKIIFDDFKPETRLISYVCAKVLNILLHYELQNFELLPYLLKSTERLLKANNIKSDAFITTDNLIKKLSPTTSKKEKHKLFTEYLSQLNNLKESGDIAFANDIALNYWAQEKLK